VLGAYRLVANSEMVHLTMCIALTFIPKADVEGSALE